MTNTVIRTGQPWISIDGSSRAGSKSRKIRISQAGVDLALLCSALFLQRFSLSFGKSLMTLDVVPAVFILIHQFLSQRLLIQYDRLLWFLGVALAVSCTLLLNFTSTMLPSYCLFIVIYSLFTLGKPTTAARYQSTLQAFQLLAALLSGLAIVQFIAQFAVDGREVVRFFGIFPEFLFTDRFNTIIPIIPGSPLIKSNGIFLQEPSTLSQISALGILVEVTEFRRSRYLLLLGLGLLLSYSGTGVLLFLTFVPVAGLAYRKALLPALLVTVLVIVLVASEIIDASAFLSRLGEFEDTQASGFERFVSPFWIARDHLGSASLRVLLLGSGPGTIDSLAENLWYGAFSGTWIKLFYEYGLIGSLMFFCFMVSCFKNTRCPNLLRAAILFTYVFLGGTLLSTPFLIIMIAIGTLSVTGVRQVRVDNSANGRPLDLIGGGGTRRQPLLVPTVGSLI